MLLLCSACATGRTDYGGNAAGAAVVMTAVALTTSAVSRAAGGCYAACPTGNKDTGYCDVLPCRGLCRADQECDTHVLIESCVPRRAPDLQIQTVPKEPAAPR